MKQQRNTRQRQLVLDVVRGRRDHPTAEQIYQSVREQDAHVSRGTVYRNLNLLCDNREIYRVVMSSSDRFDLRTDPHYHIHCLVCDSVVDVPYTYDCAYDETLEQESRAHTGEMQTGQIENRKAAWEEKNERTV